MPSRRKKSPDSEVPVVEGNALDTVEPQQTSTKRATPVLRPLDHIGVGAVVRNKDPDRHYILANPSCEITGQAHYTYLGYEIETYHKDGPMVANGLAVNDGEPITWRGSVLMSCPLERKEAMDEDGLGITHGRKGAQARIDRIYGDNTETFEQDMSAQAGGMPRKNKYFDWKSSFKAE